MEDTRRSVTRADQRRGAKLGLLEAAILQLADEGMRGLTHRRVERRAGLAQGSAKYYFGSLASLVEAVLTHLVETDLPLVLEVTPAEREAARADPTTLLARAQVVAEAMSARPERVRARFHLYLHAAANPELQPVVAAARAQFVARIARSLPGPGAEAGARFVCAVVDGMLLDQCSAPSEIVDAYAARYLLAAGAAGSELAAVG